MMMILADLNTFSKSCDILWTDWRNKCCITRMCANSSASVWASVDLLFWGSGRSVSCAGGERGCWGQNQHDVRWQIASAKRSASGWLGASLQWHLQGCEFAVHNPVNVDNTHLAPHRCLRDWKVWTVWLKTAEIPTLLTTVGSLHDITVSLNLKLMFAQVWGELGECTTQSVRTSSMYLGYLLITWIQLS